MENDKRRNFPEVEKDDESREYASPPLAVPRVPFDVIIDADVKHRK